MKGREIKLGELVLIKDEVIPHSQWRIGRVYKLQKEIDDKIRGANLKVINDKNNVYVNRAIRSRSTLRIEIRQSHSLTKEE